MAAGIIMDLQVEMLAILQIFTQVKYKKDDVMVDRRVSCRRLDRRTYTYKRTSISSDVHYDKLQEKDRRVTGIEMRKQDRRALERIKSI